MRYFVLVITFVQVACVSAFAETVSSQLNLKVGDRFVLASTKRNQMWLPGALEHSIIVSLREQFDVVGKTSAGYRIKVTLLDMEAHWGNPLKGGTFSVSSSSQPTAGSADQLVPVFSAVIEHSVGTSIDMVTDRKGTPLKLIGWRERCREVAEQVLAKASASSDEMIRDITRQVFGDEAAMDDKTALKELGATYVIWSMHHNFKKKTGKSRRSFIKIRSDRFLGHSEQVVAHRNKVVITALEQFGQGKAATSGAGNGQTTQSYIQGKTVAMSQEWRHEISRDSGMTLRAFLERISDIGPVRKEEAWTITLEQ